MDLTPFLTSIGHEIDDVEEESFLLFTQDIPSGNLGFIDSRAASIDATIHGQDYSIHQSPTVLSSSRAGGTTGAVLWKITPLFAQWISAQQSNPLWTHSLLSSTSTVVELGCGISPLTALALSPLVSQFIATDQEYVQKLFRYNLDANAGASASVSLSKGKKGRGSASASASKKKGQKKGGDATPTSVSGSEANSNSNITFTSLDWELDAPSTLKDALTSSQTPDDDHEEEEDKGFDLIISCDCIYNDALVAPFVRTCADICRLRPAYNPSSSSSSSSSRSKRNPTICIIAQQQRAPDVFEEWLQETMRVFRVWRVSDEVLGEGLKSGTGYLVHLLMLKE
ncbi:hypothetical protein ASPWEDRAFT_45105 [Aspergillus wentii DTO 134E9]|uniref:Diaminohydroxyphosphoribosylamino-pyrimidine deaminase n=1 Tax=Aspergillus wentii DTO 134E9 TaxID=1073089 RepID=A0A1L9R8E9_ASPWE|nr:uncharacterized protein ASPWEDRAFT_45105 [Aspergillus wentii DTO 134E9]KAI9924981.1 hypothetical protein MW887_006388 [Aspergillus wentii]OJJ31147.1 hypothetical protein ASPWEDRAFT_45105 [Aspergillus wentii DTO 134E9]